MTRFATWHAARFAGNCATCRASIIRGDAVMTVQAPRRTLCRACGRKLDLRDAYAAEDRKGARDHAKALERRLPPGDD